MTNFKDVNYVFLNNSKKKLFIKLSEIYSLDLLNILNMKISQNYSIFKAKFVIFYNLLILLTYSLNASSVESLYFFIKICTFILIYTKN